MTIPAHDAIERLRDGNRRFVEGPRRLETLASEARREELVSGQQPFAIVLGCADSRVPAEIIFDQGLGDLFVVRVAGNVAAPSQIGSIEYAAGACGARLIVVLGHAGCGAVAATLDAIRQPTELSEGLRAIVDRIQPAVEPLLRDAEANTDPENLLRRAVQANVHATVRHLKQDSPSLSHLQRDDGLLIIGAEYSLDTGMVEFLDQP